MFVFYMVTNCKSICRLFVEITLWIIITAGSIFAGTVRVYKYYINGTLSKFKIFQITILILYEIKYTNNNLWENTKYIHKITLIFWI